MRVVTWNLQHGVPDPKGPPDLASGLAPLAALRGDVYGLQELDCGRDRTGRANQAAVIAEAVDGRVLWAPAISSGRSAYGNALVVRGELLEGEVVRLPGRAEPRVVAVARVEVDGRQWSVGTCHLSLDNATAQRQLVAALDALVALPAPRVLAGDLNLVPTRVLPITTVEGFHLVGGPPTCNARKTPRRRLDHVLVQGARVAGAGVAKLPLSDHLAVWADLT
jgi:endonuclease/exonuclease/phosphatase family metal-dependent hydrolase